MLRFGLVSLLVGALLSVGGPAHAEPARGTLKRAPATPPTPALPALTAAERQALLGGATVSRPLRFERGQDGAYIGGVSYQIVRSTPGRVLAALADVEALPRALPRTERATLISRAGTRATIELTQGKAPFLATYSVQVEQAASGDAIRFWLDASRPHDVRDVWGYFRVTPFGADRSLVTLAVALDMGPGLARMLLTDRVERIILRAPSKIREYVEPLRLTSTR